MSEGASESSSETAPLKGAYLSAALSSGAPRAAAAKPAPSAASGEEPAPRAADLPPVCEPVPKKKSAPVFDELPPPPEPDWGAPPWEPYYAPDLDAAPKRAARAAAEAPGSAPRRAGADFPVSESVKPEDPFPKGGPLPAAASSDGATVSGDESPEVVFGKFLRRLRKLPKSGVVYTLCRDLAASREGDTLVLTTDVRTVADTLNGERHAPIMREVFAEMGVEKFEVRYASEERRDEKAGLEQLKKDFSDYPIDIK